MTTIEFSINDGGFSTTIEENPVDHEEIVGVIAHILWTSATQLGESGKPTRQMLEEIFQQAMLPLREKP